MFYKVVHRNGTDGVYSDWYTDKSGISLEEAREVVKELKKRRGNGWYAHIRILDKDGNEALTQDSNLKEKPKES